MQFQEAKKFILGKLKKELPKYLSYHSVEHIKDVYESCKNIGKQEKIKGDERTLLLTAALFHDSGFLKGPKDHEKVSCEIARENLPRFGYSAADIERICGMIMATKIPQSPKNHLEQIICDADLDYLGRDDFFTISDKLFTELSFYGIIHNDTGWNRLQESFFESHHYFTHSSLKHRAPKKAEHLALIKSKLNSAE